MVGHMAVVGRKPVVGHMTVVGHMAVVGRKPVVGHTAVAGRKAGGRRRPAACHNPMAGSRPAHIPGSRAVDQPDNQAAVCSPCPAAVVVGHGLHPVDGRGISQSSPVSRFAPAVLHNLRHVRVASHAWRN